MDDELTLPSVPDDKIQAHDFETTYGPEMRCEGRYEVDPIAGGKRFQGSWLILDDGTRYVISYRPIPAYYHYVDKRVCVTGRPYTPGRDTQQILAAHFEIISIELAFGEVPYEKPQTILPAPPVLRTLDDIRAHAGRWGQVVGKLTALTDDSDISFMQACLDLEDGTQITALYAVEQQWRSFLGSTITVMSRIETFVPSAGSRGEKEEIVLTGWYAICPGVEKRCGM